MTRGVQKRCAGAHVDWKMNIPFQLKSANVILYTTRDFLPFVLNSNSRHGDFPVSALNTPVMLNMAICMQPPKSCDSVKSVGGPQF